MHLTVKVLNGEECSIAASPSSTVLDVKQQVSALLSVPIQDQKLLYLGKPLQDERVLSEYSVKDGGKLMLVIKKSTTTPSSDNAKSPELSVADLAPVWQKLLVFLNRHFTSKDAQLVLLEFKRDFEKGLSSLSLDDIERLAQSKMPESEER
ncbi:ubiquitin-like protein 4A [Gigantopelta aegis]|uniref:ubiquitin-like protein 4A n=1 Tax=Gigantopelta aegis TaxID=1735272 RepID=UPI001B88BFA0|nr:ubiquitin-like protein 4A [Gigantopelta aegis]